MKPSQSWISLKGTLLNWLTSWWSCLVAFITFCRTTDFEQGFDWQILCCAENCCPHLTLLWDCFQLVRISWFFECGVWRVLHLSSSFYTQALGQLLAFRRCQCLLRESVCPLHVICIFSYFLDFFCCIFFLFRSMQPTATWRHKVNDFSWRLWMSWKWPWATRR